MTPDVLMQLDALLHDSVPCAAYTVQYAIAWLPIILAALSGASLFGGRGGSDGGNTAGLPPDLAKILQDVLGRQNAQGQRTDPLHAATMSGIHQFLPEFARAGGARGVGLGTPGVPSFRDTADQPFPNPLHPAQLETPNF